MGGTFDPVHNAHLAMARAAQAHLDLEKIYFMPTGRPHYRTPAVAGGEYRVAMLHLAVAGDPAFEVDVRELAPGASGYTVDVLRELRLELGADTPLWLLMGADQYAKLDEWHRPDDVRRLARIAVFSRPGFPAPQGATVVPFDPMAVSSSEIRERLARGEDIAALVPASVAGYIAANGLYR